MKLNKQILEAVRRGIQLALDDYEDIETSNSISHNNDIIDSDDVIQTEIDFWDQWVDLGLPSGTLWAKSNIGADCDDYEESWYGEHFAWGETEPKEKYDWETYKFGEATQLTKYCYDTKYSANYIIQRTDDLNELQSKDDAASVLLKHHSHIPTKEQMMELLNYTSQVEIFNYNNIDGLHGIIFIGKNKKSIFMPMAGSMSSSIKVSMNARYWTSTLSKETPMDAYYLDWGRGYQTGQLLHDYRCYGMSIRPVYNR